MPLVSFYIPEVWFQSVDSRSDAFLAGILFASTVHFSPFQVTHSHPPLQDFLASSTFQEKKISVDRLNVLYMDMETDRHHLARVPLPLLQEFDDGVVHFFDNILKQEPTLRLQCYWDI